MQRSLDSRSNSKFSFNTLVESKQTFLAIQRVDYTITLLLILILRTTIYYIMLLFDLDKLFNSLVSAFILFVCDKSRFRSVCLTLR